MRGETVQIPCRHLFSEGGVFASQMHVLRKIPAAPYLLLLAPSRAVPCWDLHPPVLFLAPVGQSSASCGIPTRNASDTPGTAKWERTNDFQSSQQPWHLVV